MVRISHHFCSGNTELECQGGFSPESWSLPPRAEAWGPWCWGLRCPWQWTPWRRWSAAACLGRWLFAETWDSPGTRTAPTKWSEPTETRRCCSGSRTFHLKWYDGSVRKVLNWRSWLLHFVDKGSQWRQGLLCRLFSGPSSFRGAPIPGRGQGSIDI